MWLRVLVWSGAGVVWAGVGVCAGLKLGLPRICSSCCDLQARASLVQCGRFCRIGEMEVIAALCVWPGAFVQQGTVATGAFHGWKAGLKTP
jgi:hypothetical protein